MAIAGTIGAPSSEERGLDLRTVTTVTAAALAIADMIGIGVFTSLGFQVQGIPSAFAVLMLWIVGGIAALCGALSYARARRRAAALGRRIQLSVAHLRAQHRLRRRVDLGDRRLRGARRAGGHGVRRLLRRHRAGHHQCGDGGGVLHQGLAHPDRHRLARRSHAPERRGAGQHVPQRRDRPEARADRRPDLRRACARHAAADLVRAVGVRPRTTSRARRSRSGSCS